jgi:hypothetical protein
MLQSNRTERGRQTVHQGGSFPASQADLTGWMAGKPDAFSPTEA